MLNLRNANIKLINANMLNLRSGHLKLICKIKNANIKLDLRIAKIKLIPC